MLGHIWIGHIIASCKRFTYTKNSTGINRRLLPFFLMMKCIASLSFYYPKASKQMKLAGLLACSIFDAFPSKKGQWLAEIKDIRGAYSSGVCSGFSPDSLFTHHLKMRGDKHQILLQIYGGFLKMQAKFQ